MYFIKAPPPTTHEKPPLYTHHVLRRRSMSRPSRGLPSRTRERAKYTAGRIEPARLICFGSPKVSRFGILSTAPPTAGPTARCSLTGRRAALWRSSRGTARQCHGCWPPVRPREWSVRAGGRRFTLEGIVCPHLGPAGPAGCLPVMAQGFKRRNLHVAAT